MEEKNEICWRCQKPYVNGDKYCMYCSAELQAVPVGGNEKESILEQVACSYAAMVQSVRGMKPLTASSNLKRLGWFAAVNVGIMLTLLPIIAPGVFIIPIIGIASAFISLALSSFLAKRSHGVIILDPKENLSEDARDLHEMVRLLSIKAGLEKMPEVGVYESEDVNAFATGMSKNSSCVAFSTALLETCDEKAVVGVAAHEIAHIANGDMVTMTMVQAVINSLVMLITIPLWTVRTIAFFSDSVDWLTSLLIDIFRMIISSVLCFGGQLIAMAFSRHREFAADFGAACLVEKETMVHALKQISSAPIVSLPREQKVLAAFKINSSPAWFDIFSTHPSLERRIAKLEAVSETR